MPDELGVICNILDNQLVDRNQQPIGRADGLIMELRDGAPPRLVAIEIGTAVLARRLHPRLEAITAKLLRRFPRQNQPYRIPFEKVRDVGIDIDVDLLADETPLLDSEKWLRDHIVKRIPGGQA